MTVWMIWELDSMDISLFSSLSLQSEIKVSVMSRMQFYSNPKEKQKKQNRIKISSSSLWVVVADALAKTWGYIYQRQSG